MASAIKNSAYSILNQQVWDDLVIRKNGVKIIVPKSNLTCEGQLPKKIQDKLKKLTPQNATVLYTKYGITCECEGSQLGLVEQNN